ncbi:L-type lectin-domain containing receptor kinase IV.1-like [Ziziphus jujuba]|uniref:non-specific serine/threonine protein kinase n=1 Tax=Ziziphus jujuba TaxID=326968 RepID=A0A6P3ZX52_ZIZJJ|nr:L-type lectin-domain containing receptor kinase IV.1-like [Ziziphus jujuba]
MFAKLVSILSFYFIIVSVFAAEDLSFTYNGFKSADLLNFDGIAKVTSNGILMLTNDTKQQQGHAFYTTPLTFKNSMNSSAFSFSTTFVFAIRSELYQPLSGHGIAFVIAPRRELPGAVPSEFLGLFNQATNGKGSNQIVAVELDTVNNYKEFGDINDNHVGIDINGLRSVTSAPAGYHADGGFRNLPLISGKSMQVWVEYDGENKRMDVSLAPVKVGKPRIPLLSLTKDLSPIFNNSMYVGFSASTGSVPTSHCILGWSFKMNGLQAQELVLSQLPKLPKLGSKNIRSTILLAGLPLISLTILALAILGLVYVIRRKRKFMDLVEDWEIEYGPHRYKYKDLYTATRGFKDDELLGVGGFGRVYRGVLPMTKSEIAVKRVSHESKQGMREFVAEIVSIGRLRHRNLVPLLGYCRRKGELLLVYDYMPNGSLDKYIYDQPKTTLNWTQRYRIIKGVSSGLLYLHEEWEQVVVHRDVKASNVLLDAEFNGRLGDFGLAKLYDHGTDPQTTHIVGTLGYLAPENTRTGKATTSSDVFAFGAFLLEVACGRRPIGARNPLESEEMILVDQVFSWWKKGDILEARDPKLGSEFVAEQVELVLMLGLLCSVSEPASRPSMRQVVHYLEGEMALPSLELLAVCSNGLAFAHHEGFDDIVATPSPFSVDQAFCSQKSSTADWLLSDN